MNLEGQRTVSAPVYRKGDDAATLFARAQVYQQFGHFAEAEVGYKKVLKKRPNHVDALHMLGICAHQSGDLKAAEHALRRAVLLNPQSAAALTHLGVVLASLQRHDDAITTFRKATAIDPIHVEALANMGPALHALGRFEDAIDCYDRLLALKPDHLAALVNRGAAFKDLRQAEQAIAAFDRALAVHPQCADAWMNRGDTLLGLRRLDDALASFDKALAIDPKLALAWLGRANILMLTGQVTDALALCQRALAIEPSAKAHTQIGQCHALQGDAESALACFESALAIQPDDEAALSNLIFTGDFAHDRDFAFHQAVRAQWWQQVGSRIAANGIAPHANDRDPGRRLVIGYVSAEFRQRSAAFTYRPVLTHHDKTQFEIICYSGTPVEDDVTVSFRHCADQWRDVLEWSDDRLANCIRADKVDILIDLSGHGDGNRLRVFAQKPAPVQVTAWGHANGTGLPLIDYLFSDSVMVPPEVRHLFPEQVCDLPCAIAIEPPPLGTRSPEPPVTANGYVTYGALNRVSKFSNAAIALWARILKADTTARLLIKHYEIDDVSIRAMLLEKFAAHGIAPDRIEPVGSTSREAHLATYARVDICLDPFPHGGGVSTWESLHMGVPTVSKIGNSATSRVGSAILSATGLTDWVATDDDQYIEIALRSAPDRLRSLRVALPDMIEQSTGAVVYTKAVETAYRDMWTRYCGALEN